MPVDIYYYICYNESRAKYIHRQRSKVELQGRCHFCKQEDSLVEHHWLEGSSYHSIQACTSCNNILSARRLNQLFGGFPPLAIQSLYLEFRLRWQTAATELLREKRTNPTETRKYFLKRKQASLLELLEDLTGEATKLGYGLSTTTYHNLRTLIEEGKNIWTGPTRYHSLGPSNS